MNSIIPLIDPPGKRRPQAGIFLSGSGTNAEIILKKWKNGKSSFDIAFLFTDRPEISTARVLAQEYHLPIVENDVKKFYHQHGCKRISITTPQGRETREEWTRSIREQLQNHNIDFAIFAGFIPLTNITADFPCLNVHPGDLTYIKNERRYLVGLHTIPIELAILEGLSELRSSVIIANPYDNDVSKMDNGPILGISGRVSIDFKGNALEDLTRIAGERPVKRPRNGFGDKLENIAKFNLDKLKREGDWTVLPAVAEEFAQGRYALDNKGLLHYRKEQHWLSIKTIKFKKDKGISLVNL